MNMSKSVLVQGRNRENARALLAAAERLGLPPEVVKTSSYGGYLVPEEVQAELANAPEEDDFENAPTRAGLYGLAPDEDPQEAPDQRPASVEPGPGGGDSQVGPGRLDGPAESARVGSSGAEPPRGGAGATREAWAAYADSIGVEYGDEDKRDDIIEKVDAKAEEETD